MNKSSLIKHRMFFRIISIIIVISFSMQNVLWANDNPFGRNANNNYKLAPWHDNNTISELVNEAKRLLDKQQTSRIDIESVDKMLEELVTDLSKRSFVREILCGIFGLKTNDDIFRQERLISAPMRSPHAGRKVVAAAMRYNADLLDEAYKEYEVIVPGVILNDKFFDEFFKQLDENCSNEDAIKVLRQFLILFSQSLEEWGSDLYRGLTDAREEREEILSEISRLIKRRNKGKPEKRVRRIIKRTREFVRRHNTDLIFHNMVSTAVKSFQGQIRFSAETRLLLNSLTPFTVRFVANSQSPIDIDVNNKAIDMNIFHALKLSKSNDEYIEKTLLMQLRRIVAQENIGQCVEEYPVDMPVELLADVALIILDARNVNMKWPIEREKKYVIENARKTYLNQLRVHGSGEYADLLERLDQYEESLSDSVAEEEIRLIYNYLKELGLVNRYRLVSTGQFPSWRDVLRFFQRNTRILNDIEYGYQTLEDVESVRREQEERERERQTDTTEGTLTGTQSGTTSTPRTRQVEIVTRRGEHNEPTEVHTVPGYSSSPESSPGESDSSGPGIVSYFSRQRQAGSQEDEEVRYEVDGNTYEEAVRDIHEALNALLDPALSEHDKLIIFLREILPNYFIALSVITASRAIKVANGQTVGGDDDEDQVRFDSLNGLMNGILNLRDTSGELVFGSDANEFKRILGELFVVAADISGINEQIFNRLRGCRYLIDNDVHVVVERVYRSLDVGERNVSAPFLSMISHEIESQRYVDSEAGRLPIYYLGRRIDHVDRDVSALGFTYFGEMHGVVLTDMIRQVSYARLLPYLLGRVREGGHELNRLIIRALRHDYGTVSEDDAETIERILKTAYNSTAIHELDHTVYQETVSGEIDLSRRIQTESMAYLASMWRGTRSFGRNVYREKTPFVYRDRTENGRSMEEDQFDAPFTDLWKILSLYISGPELSFVQIYYPCSVINVVEFGRELGIELMGHNNENDRLCNAANVLRHLLNARDPKENLKQIAYRIWQRHRDSWGGIQRDRETSSDTDSDTDTDGDTSVDTRESAGRERVTIPEFRVAVENEVDSDDVEDSSGTAGTDNIEGTTNDDDTVDEEEAVVAPDEQTEQEETDQEGTEESLLGRLISWITEGNEDDEDDVDDTEDTVAVVDEEDDDIVIPADMLSSFAWDNINFEGVHEYINIQNNFDTRERIYLYIAIVIGILSSLFFSIYLSFDSGTIAGLIGALGLPLLIGALVYYVIYAIDNIIQIAGEIVRSLGRLINRLRQLNRYSIRGAIRRFMRSDLENRAFDVYFPMSVVVGILSFILIPVCLGVSFDINIFLGIIIAAIPAVVSALVFYHVLIAGDRFAQFISWLIRPFRRAYCALNNWIGGSVSNVIGFLSLLLMAAGFIVFLVSSIFTIANSNGANGIDLLNQTQDQQAQTIDKTEEKEDEKEKTEEEKEGDGDPDNGIADDADYIYKFDERTALKTIARDFYQNSNIYWLIGSYNGKLAREYMYAGETIKLPAKITLGKYWVKDILAGKTTLWAIAREFNIDWNRFKQMNPHIEFTTNSAGWEVANIETDDDGNPVDEIIIGVRNHIIEGNAHAEAGSSADNIGKNVQHAISEDKITITGSDFTEECDLREVVDINADKIMRTANELNVAGVLQERFSVDFRESIEGLKIRYYEGVPATKAAGALGYMHEGILYLDHVLSDNDMAVIHEAIHAVLSDVPLENLESAIDAIGNEEIRNKIRTKAKEAVGTGSGSTYEAYLRHYYARYYLQNELGAVYAASKNERLTIQIKLVKAAEYLGIELNELSNILDSLKDPDGAEVLRNKFLKLVSKDGKITEGEIRILVDNIKRVLEVIDRIAERIDDVDKKEAVTRISLYLSIMHLTEKQINDELPLCMKKLLEQIDSMGLESQSQRIRDLLDKEPAAADLCLAEIMDAACKNDPDNADKIRLDELIGNTRKYLYARAIIAESMQVDTKDIEERTPAANIAKVVQEHLRNKENKQRIVEILARHMTDNESFSIEDSARDSIERIIRSKKLEERVGEGLSIIPALNSDLHIPRTLSADHSIELDHAV